MTLTDTPLDIFDAVVDILRPGPPTILFDDSPRTRKTDPVTSHAAADQSQRMMHDTKVHVLLVLSVHHELSGSDLNDMYRLATARHGWKKVAWDSPRKRAGELVKDGYLNIVGTREGTNGTLESVYALSEKGQRVVDLGIVR